jgi:hypothetical protein
MAETRCPITGAPTEELDSTGDRRDFISPTLGGRYAIAGTLGRIWQPRDDRQREAITHWIEKRRREGDECPLVTSYVLDELDGK